MRILDASRMTAFAGLAYALAYLYLIGDVDPQGAGNWGVVVGDWSAWFERRGLLHFEPILLLELGPLLWLFSPLNLLLATVLGSLLAGNLHGAWHLCRRRDACALPSESKGSSNLAAGGGLFAALPAMLAGGACCAPSLLLLLGMPGLGAFAGLFGWLLPVSLLVLLCSRFWQRHRGAPRFSWQRPASASHGGG